MSLSYEVPRTWALGSGASRKGMRACSLRGKVGIVSIFVIIKLGLELLLMGESGLQGHCGTLLPYRLQVK